MSAVDSEQSPHRVSNPMGRIILVRHGPTQFNVEGRLQGQMDIPLSHEGKRKAASLAPHVLALLREVDNCVALTSPLRRARSTAEILCSHVDIPLRVDARLTEVSFGCWEGLTIREINARWRGTPQSSRLSWANFCPDGEPYEDAIGRADDWLKDFGDRNVLIVTHGVIGSLIRGRYARLSKDEMLRLPVGHNTIVVLSDGKERQFQYL